MPTIVYEIFPITLHEGRVVLLQREHGGDLAPWYVQCDLCLHPSHAVSRAVEAHFGPLFDPRTSVVHSTSWRYESGPEGEGRIVLTYLAVFPSGCWLRAWIEEGRLTLRDVDGVRLSRGGNGPPPDVISSDQVLAHALEHLAMLVEVDTAVRSALIPEWEPALRGRLPLPAGYPQAWV